jgi:hypothetical protein
MTVTYVDQFDGTRWFFSEGLNIWTGWMPGEDGCWTLTPDEYEADYGDRCLPPVADSNPKGATT